MRIVLTNDDGFESEGINVLATHLSDEHEVWIVAPDRNRSAVSNSITMNKALKIKKIRERVYSCSGTPVDCVIVALKSGLVSGVPDVVMSGINRGPNIGTDILYSGTCAGARQAVLYGVPGIALSVSSFDNAWQYDAMARFAKKNINSLIALTHTSHRDGTPDGECFFVNVNGASCEQYSGVQYADEISFREYCDGMHLLDAPDGATYGFFCGGTIVSHGGVTSDSAICEKNYVAVSRVYAEPCVSKHMDGISFSV